jgi:hypothetical protein
MAQMKSDNKDDHVATILVNQRPKFLIVVMKFLMMVRCEQYSERSHGYSQPQIFDRVKEIVRCSKGMRATDTMLLTNRSAHVLFSFAFDSCAQKLPRRWRP